VADNAIGGIGAVVNSQTAWFTARGWQVVVAGPDPLPEIPAGSRWERVPIPEASRQVGAMRQAARRLRELHRAEPTTVVHCHGTRSYLVARMARISDAFVTLHGHGSAEDDPWLNRVARRAGLRLVPRLTPLAITASPIDVPGWRFAVHASPRLADLEPMPFPPAESTPCFLWIGRIDVVKRCDQFVRAIAEIARTTPIRGVIAGDGPSAAAVDELIASTGAPVTRLGWVDNLDPYLAEAWAVALFSTKEAVAFSLQEGMWVGRPVVASRLPGLEWLVGDVSVGGLFDDDASAGAAMRSLLDHRRAEEAGRAAAARVRSLISVEDPWPLVLAEYERVLSGGA
jgi:glycosyltransferase involved in cell wall biosynthesis